MVHIFSERALPEHFILQPMKNTDKVRSFLLENSYSVERDYTFSDEKFYDVLCAVHGGKPRRYDRLSILFGYDNLHSPGEDFLKYLRMELQKCRDRLSASADDIPAVSSRMEQLTEALHEAERNLRFDLYTSAVCGYDTHARPESGACRFPHQPH